MKRILIFSTTYHPFVGGAEIAVKELTDRIGDFSYDMITARIDASLPREEMVGAIRVYRVGFGSPWDKILLPILGYIKALQLYREKTYDGVWSIMASYAGFACVFFKFTYKKVPYLLTLQEGDPIEDILKKVRLVRPLFNQIFIRADRIQVISTFLEGWARDMGFIGPIEVIPNGFDQAVFEKKPSKEETEKIKGEIENKQKDADLSEFFAENTRVMITTSRLVHKNGIDMAIQSLIALPENIKFLIVGDGPLFDKLERFAVARGVRHRVCFVGEVAYEDLYKYLGLPEVFVFVRPSRSEGMGNSFVESMASGVPVVATPVGGITDFVCNPEMFKENNPTGLCAIPDDHPSVSAAIREYSEDEELRQRIIKNGQNLARKSYQWDDLAVKMKKTVFDKLVTV